jgi:hypothetical protein
MGQSLVRVCTRQWADLIAPLMVSPATLDEHEADTFGEHEFVNVLSPWPSIGGAVMVELSR